MARAAAQRRVLVAGSSAGHRPQCLSPKSVSQSVYQTVQNVLTALCSATIGLLGKTVVVQVVALTALQKHLGCDVLALSPFFHAPQPDVFMRCRIGWWVAEEWVCDTPVVARC
jgi:hypothetical protein